jgi:hypothetical protein
MTAVGIPDEGMVGITIWRSRPDRIGVRLAVRSAIRAVGAKLFFPPPYSPDLNPIEQILTKLKTLRRTVEATWKRVGSPRRLPAKRMRKLHRQRRIRFSVRQSRSNWRSSKTASSTAATPGYFPDNAVNTSIIKTAPLLAISRAVIGPENRWELGSWRATSDKDEYYVRAIAF